MAKFAVWGGICLVISAGFFLNAWSIYRSRRRFLETAASSEGTVVEVRREGTGRNITSFPVFDFMSSSGAMQRATSLMGTGFQRFAVGDRVPVLYDPRDPSRAEVGSRAVLWGLALLRGGFGVVFLVLGFVGLLAA